MKGFARLILALAACCTGIAVLFAVQQAAWRNQITSETIRLEAAAMAEQRIARAAAWTQTVAALYDLVYAAAFLALGLAAVLAIFAAIGLYQRNQLRRLMPTPNGLYPLQVIAGQVINPNLMIYPSLADNTPGAIPPQIALAASASTDRIAVTGNLADMRLTAAGAKLLAGRYDRPADVAPPSTVQPAPPARQLPAPETLDLAAAWQQSSYSHWLLGQSESGAVYDLTLSALTHVGLLGATGTGKTSSTALLIAMYAARYGYGVLVLDGKGGLDWRQYAANFDVQNCDYATIGEQIAAVEALHTQRMADLRSGVSGLQPLLVLVEEYGHTMQALRMSSSAVADEVAGAQSNLMRVSRATRIHFLLVDQTPQAWPGVIKANIGAWLAYRLGGQQANAVNLYHTHKLPAAGAFVASTDGGETVYNAWHTAAAAAPLLRTLPPAQRIIDAPYSVAPSFTDPVRSPFAVRSPEYAPTPPTPNERPAPPIPSTEDSWYDWTLSTYLTAHPELLTTDPQGRGVGIAALARAMAAIRYGDPSQYEPMKSTASAVASRIRRTVRVDGAALGVDRSVIA